MGFVYAFGIASSDVTLLKYEEIILICNILVWQRSPCSLNPSHPLAKDSTIHILESAIVSNRGDASFALYFVAQPAQLRPKL